VLFEPRNDDGRIETAGISQRYFFRFRFGHYLLQQH
jgi:hypothetical protein